MSYEHRFIITSFIFLDVVFVTFSYKSISPYRQGFLLLTNFPFSIGSCLVLFQIQIYFTRFQPISRGKEETIVAPRWQEAGRETIFKPRGFDPLDLRFLHGYGRARVARI